MKNWYIMIHFDGIYVSGFFVFGQPDQESARKELLNQLIGRKMIERACMIAGNKIYSTELSRVKAFIRTLNHPWRKDKEGRNIIEYREMTNECVVAGYWAKDVFLDVYYCNLQPRPKIG